MEQKRLEAEAKFLETTKQRAADLEREAEELALRALEREQQQQREKQQRHEAALLAESEAQRKVADEELQRQKKIEAERAAEEKLQTERREAMEQNRQRAEKEAELRQLASDVAAGKLVLIKKKNGFMVAPTAGGSAKPVQLDDTLSWVRKHAVVEDEAEEPAVPAPRRTFGPQSTKTSTTNLAEQPQFLNAQPQEKGAVPSLPTMLPRQGNVLEIVRRLQSPHEQMGALLDLLDFILKKLAKGGVDYLLRESHDGVSRFAFHDMPKPLAEILRDKPGNIPAMMILGILGFCGDDTLHQKVMEQKVLPTNPDAWIRSLVGSKLFLSSFCGRSTHSSLSSSFGCRQSNKVGSCWMGRRPAQLPVMSRH